MVKKMQDDLYNHLITIARSGYDIESGYRRLKKQEIDELVQQEADDKNLLDRERYEYVSQRTDDLLGVFDR
tara:strand:+ start:1482 stop:1694 length:213 start_codon:yes stop_codon:yes gene_type:complete